MIVHGSHGPVVLVFHVAKEWILRHGPAFHGLDLEMSL